MSTRYKPTGERVGRVLLTLLVVLTALLISEGTSVHPARAQGIECGDIVPVASPPASGVPASPAAAAEAPFPESGGELTVFAASSLTEAFDQIATDLEAANPGLTITYNFAGSQTLVAQLAEGAEADVFASANMTQMSAAQDEGVIAGEPATFARNRLAIVVPFDNPAGISAPADLSKDGLKLVLAAPDVPVGQYARESICRMGADTDTYGEGFVDAVAGNLVSEEENVRAVLAKVQLGEADAGIVYSSDVSAEMADDVSTIEIPEAVNVIAGYPIAAVEGGDAALASAFIAYVLGPDGQATLTEFGFLPAS
jgi:molybdate transport system substrate-binding protein